MKRVDRSQWHWVGRVLLGLVIGLAVVGAFVALCMWAAS